MPKSSRASSIPTASRRCRLDWLLVNRADHPRLLAIMHDQYARDVLSANAVKSACIGRGPSRSGDMRMSHQGIEDRYPHQQSTDQEVASEMRPLSHLQYRGSIAHQELESPQDPVYIRIRGILDPQATQRSSANCHLMIRHKSSCMAKMWMTVASPTEHGY